MASKRTGSVIWTCDRCGSEYARSGETFSHPPGWGPVTAIVRGHVDIQKDLCNKCMEAFKAWFEMEMKDGV